MFVDLRKWFWYINKPILVCILFLLIVGTLTILRLSYIMSNRFNASYDLIFFLKHFVFVSLSLVFLFIFSSINLEKAIKVCFVIFFTALFLNFLTVALGTKVNGVKRWIRIGGFSLQSSEFVKTLIVLPVCHLLINNEHRKNIFLIGFSALSCLIQPDLGMTFLIISSSSSMVILVGKRLRDYLKIIIFSAIGIIISGAFLTKYAANRLMIFFGKKEGFQITQSLKLFASSKFIGEDINNIYVPDSHCDFMFAEIVSGFGVISGIIVIGIPLTIFLVTLNKARKLNTFHKLIAIGIANQIAIQSYFHILSNMALVPTKGLNLPFASFGGSALIAHSICVGLLLNLTKRTLIF